jgi:hypothetical protein
MDQELKRKIEELEDYIKTLKAENQELKKQLEGIGITEAKELSIRQQIAANQSTIAANTRQVTKILNKLSTEGTIRWHLSFHILSFPWFEFLNSHIHCELSILWISITTKILIFLLASDL